MNPNLKKLEDLINLVDSDKITHDEFAKVFEAFKSLVDDFKLNLEAKILDNKSEIDGLSKDVSYTLSSLELSVKDLINSSERANLNKIKELSQRLSSEINRVESNIPQIKDWTAEVGYLESLIRSVEDKIPQLPEPQEMETGQSIVDKVNELPIDDDMFKIGKEHIKGLVKDITEINFRINSLGSRGGMGGGGGLSQVYHDSTLSGNGTSSSPLTVIGGGSGGGSLAFQTLSGTINGSNTTFTFSSAISGKSIIDLNGQLLIEDTDYTISGTTVTYVTAPPSNGGIDTHVLISGGGAVATVTSVNNEIVSGSGTTFTLANTPTAGSVRVFGLGQRLVPTTDYSISGAVITPVSSWSAGQILADYTY